MNELRVRPYAEYFLNEMAQYYEIVVFTAAMKDVFPIFLFNSIWNAHLVCWLGNQYHW